MKDWAFRAKANFCKKSLDGIGAKVQAALNGEVQEFYWKHKKRSGELFDTDVTVCRFHIDEEIYLQIIVRDTTELRRTKEMLDRKLKELERYMASNSELKQFAHSTAHDLKEPLRSIGSFSKLLQQKQKGKLDDASQEYLSFIVKGVSNMTQLIRDLLDYSKATAENQQVFKGIELQTILDVIVQHDLRQQIEESQAQVSFKNIPHIITCIPIKIKQLFYNLITNAIKFRSEDRLCRVVVRAQELDDVFLFEVQDNGIGISHENTNRIFDVFTRLHSKQEYEGSGIGLATCKKIVQQHGGRIWATSEFGEGTTFSFSIAK